MVVSSRPKNSSAGRFRLPSGWALPFEFGDFLLLLLQLVGAAEGLGAVFLQLRFPAGKRHRMNVVGPGDLRVGSIGLERFEYDLEFEFGAISALTHGGCGWIDSELQETKRPASQPQS